ncbi:hypothetical protein KY337_02880 [Candidatus Woesearchaeota archaeon]|nr:hypothetical protein [Candidatus Woesearchaeota archaeon]
MNCFQTLGVVVFLVVIMIMLSAIAVEKESNDEPMYAKTIKVKNSVFSVSDYVSIAAIFFAFGLMTAGFIKWWKC